MTGVYSISMNLCGAIASGISVPLAVGAGFKWQGALGIWGDPMLQRSLVIITTILLLTGTLGLLYGSSNIILLWIIILGIGGEFVFGLSMMFFGLRTKNAHQAAELSGMAQSIGYLLAAIGPALIGFLLYYLVLLSY